MGPEEILKEARDSLGPFCMTECKSYCCRKGYLPLTLEQVPAVTQGKAIELARNNIIIPISSEQFSLKLEGQGCPSLKEDFRCGIFNDSQRPKACEEYPLFLRGNTVLVSSRCLGVKENKLYPWLARLKHMGFSLQYSHPLTEGDLFTVDLQKPKEDPIEFVLDQKDPAPGKA